jgi:hypothetical protein
MSTNLQDITLESMDGTLVARNTLGHLSYPMLHIDREPVPADAAGFENVLVFVDGKTRSTITPTMIVLFEENNFSWLVEIQTGGEWSISGMDSSMILIASGQLSGVGNAQIDVRKIPTFSESGVHSCSFTVTIAGAVVSETSIQVYIVMGGRMSTSNVNPTTITLTEANDYFQTLTIESDEEWLIAGVNTERIQIAAGQMQGVGDAQITIQKAASLTATGNYASSFVVIFPGATGSAVIQVDIVVSVPLRVTHYPENGSTITARHGETITVNLNAPNYSPQYLYIYRDRAWSLENVDTSKITVSPTSGSGSNYEWDSESVSIAQSSSLTVTGLTTTTFRIVSFSQYVTIIVNIIPQITGEFVAPRSGEAGATGTAEPVYIFL